MAEAKEIFDKMERDELVDPQKFKDKFTSLHPDFRGNTQQDAGEFLYKFLSETNSHFQKIFQVYIFI